MLIQAVLTTVTDLSGCSSLSDICIEYSKTVSETRCQILVVKHTFFCYRTRRKGKTVTTKQISGNLLQSTQ